MPPKASNIKFFEAQNLANTGIRHAFTCRSGVPLEPLDKLASRLIESFNLRCLLLVKQVHGTEALLYDGDCTGIEAYRKKPFDGIITSRPGLALGVRTADCVPVLLASPGKAVAAVHGGWRGILGSVIEKTVEKMSHAYGTDTGEIVAAIGPHIGPCCYEVGPDVAEAFVKHYGNNVLGPGRRDRPHLSLEAAARCALQKTGVRAENITVTGHCTCCSPELFYSYRRDGRPTGRQISFICLL